MSQKQRERRDSDLGQGNQGHLGRKHEERALVVQRHPPSRAHTLCPTAIETQTLFQTVCTAPRHEL